MTRRIFLKISLLPLTCLLFLVLSGACQTITGPPVEQLLLSPADLPGDWQVSGEGPHLLSGGSPLGKGFGAIEALVIVFFHPAGDGSAGTYEQIYHFKETAEAEEAYTVLNQIAFSEGYDYYWAMPDFIIPPLSNASESMILCTKERAIEVCNLVARYGNYCLSLSVGLEGLNSQLEPVRVISYDEFPQIINVIEEKMEQVISGENDD